MALFVRRLRITDLPMLEQLEEVHERQSPERKGWRTRVRKLIDLALSDEPEGLLIADQDGKVVGWAAARKRPLHPLSPEKSGQILHISVAPHARRAGIGQRLLRECEAYLRTHGCEQVQIAVGATDVAAQRLMQKSGYAAEAHELVRRMSR